MILLKRDDGRLALPLPESGVLNNNGHYFHHAHTYNILPIHILRLEEHGILIKKRHSTEEDNDKLRSNWRKFAQEHNLDNKDLLKLISFQAGRSQNSKSPENLRRKEFIEKSFFWPKMCDGFPHRTAVATRQHLCILFDPLHEIKEAKDPLTEYEEKEAIQMYRKGMKFQDIAHHFHKMHHVVLIRIRFLLKRAIFSRSERRKLWNTICESSKVNTIDLHVLSKMDIDWTMIGRILFRDLKRLRDEWKMILVELTELTSARVPWIEAFEKVVPECADISASDFADFIDLFIIEKKHNDTLRCTKEEQLHIGLEMKRRGITGFRTGPLSEFKFCRYKLGRLFWTIRRNLFEPAQLCLPVHTQMKLISRCVRAFANAPCMPPRLQLKRHLVVSELIRLMCENDPQWKSPRKLRKYIDENL